MEGNVPGSPDLRACGSSTIEKVISVPCVEYNSTEYPPAAQAQPHHSVFYAPSVRPFAHKLNRQTHISNVEVDDAPLVPALFDSHRSYDTSATRPDDAEVYVHCHTVGIDAMDAMLLPSPTRRSRFASVRVELVE